MTLAKWTRIEWGPISIGWGKDSNAERNVLCAFAEMNDSAFIKHEPLKNDSALGYSCLSHK